MAELTREQLLTFDRRFWSKVNFSGSVPEHRPDLGPCWQWTGYLRENGYARILGTIRKRNERGLKRADQKGI